MKKLTAVPVDTSSDRTWRRCFGAHQNSVVFVELDCNEQGQPLLTDENERRFRKISELVERR